MTKRLAKREVVIVGGGLTAGLVARQLTAKGIDTVVLERGGDHRGAEARLPSQRDELRWDTLQGLTQNWAVETYSLRHTPNGESLPIRSMGAFHPGEGLGGAASVWNGITWRWAEYDPVLQTHHEARYGKKSIPADMPIQDWGVTYAEMEPYHDLFEKLFGVAGKAGNIKGQLQPGGNPFEAPRRDEYPQPPLETTEGGLILAEAATKKGYKPFPMPGANSTGEYVNPDGQRLGRCQYCGHCDRFVCDVQAKGTPDALLYPMLLQRKGFELRLHCQVLGVLHDRAARRVTGVRYVDLFTGEEIEQPAEVVVLAAFTMSNTKLLLSSGIGKPYDPGTETGVVGKNFCYQTVSAVNLFFEDRWINPFMGSGCTATCIDEYNGDNFDHSGLGFLGGAFIFSRVFGGRPISGHHIPPGTPRWGSKWKEAVAKWYAHAFPLLASGSCYPHRQNYLDLDPEYRDAYGQPLVRITFDWRDNELKMSAYLTSKMEDLARATGATIIGPANPRKAPFDSRPYQSTHVTGGTIMGRDPSTSVVSPRLQHWDAENLFVVGASVYPHNAGYNPTGPLAALALRLGDDLCKYAERPGML